MSVNSVRNVREILIRGGGREKEKTTGNGRRGRENEWETYDCLLTSRACCDAAWEQINFFADCVALGLQPWYV